MSDGIRAAELLAAAKGRRGVLDAMLETMDEAELSGAIIALSGGANTKREAFAMAALSALIVATEKNLSITRNDVCAEAFHYADSMLAAGELAKAQP
jgi:hypothetical protein